MADITRRPFLNHLRGTPTTYVRHVRGGRVAHEGVGRAFWFRPLPAVLSEVPVDDRELPMLFHARTADFLDVTVQAGVTFRVADPRLAADRLDWGVDVSTGRWRAAPLEQLTGIVTQLAQQPALDVLAALALREALVASPAVREAMAAALTADERLAGTGIAVLGVRVVAVRPEPDVERALQVPERERVQAEADRATFERRALAVERERAIGENELATQVELARRQEELVARKGAAERRRAQEAAAADALRATSEADRDRTVAAGRADALRAVGSAEAAAETERLAAYGAVDPAVLMALAVRELAGHLPAVGSLTVTPDLLTDLLGRLGGRPAAAVGASGGGAAVSGSGAPAGGQR